MQSSGCFPWIEFFIASNWAQDSRHSTYISQLTVQFNQSIINTKSCFIQSFRILIRIYRPLAKVNRMDCKINIFEFCVIEQSQGFLFGQINRLYVFFIRLHFMGCAGSQIQALPTTLYSSKSPIIDNLSEANKDRISHLIEKDDILSLAVAISEAGGMANSEVSDSKMKWMLTHLCCRWDADNCLEYLLKDYFCDNPRGYIDLVNAPTVQGYTCLHLCAMWKSEKCFYVLHHYGGLNFNAKDKGMKTPYQTACEYNKSKSRMKATLEAYRTMHISFSQVEGEKLISGVVIAEDISIEMKKKEDEKKMQSQSDAIKKSQSIAKETLGKLTAIQKQMIEQKSKLEKEKQQILQAKLKQQLDADAQKAKMLAESKSKVEQYERLEYEKKMKQAINEEYKKQQEKLQLELKAKDEELNRVKQDIKKKEQQRIKKEKEDAEKKAEQFMRLKQEQINRKVKEKEEALNNLKKQEEERARKQKEDADNRLKEIQLAYAKKQEEMNRKLKEREQQVARIKRQQEEKAKKDKQNAQNLTQEALKQSEQEYNKKLRQKEEQVRKYKEQEAYRLAKQKEEAEKKALELSRQQNKIVSQLTNDANKTNNQINQAVNNAGKVEQNVNNAKDSVGAAVNELKNAYANLKLQLPAELQRQYSDAKKAGAYFDSQFPADNRSIGDPSKANFANFTKNTVWLRPKQILRGDFKLFDGIDPNDIKQGSLGVCYMLASISALAETPKNIEKIFVFHDTSIGFYILRFYVNGKPKYVTVDDLIPCNKTTKSPLFTKPIGNQVWVLLLEKAWAKLIGDYLSAESMTPDHMMEDLSAAPSFGSWFQKEGKPNTEHIQKIVKHSQMGHIVVITSGQKKIEGIANNHAYSLLQAYQFNGRYIFKVRNPWGQFEWNGEYGAKSSLWTPELKKLVGYEDKDDGVFHVSENELTNAWVYYSISQITDANQYSYTQFTSKKNQNLFYKIKVTKPADINIRVTQLFERMLRDKNYKYSPLVFEVGKIISDNEVKFISEGSQKTYFGAKSVHAFENIVEKLQVGEYFIRVKMLWVNQQTYNSGVLAVYAPEPISIERLPVDKGTKYMKALFYSQALSLQKNPTGEGFYKISTMKGQFVLIGEVSKDGKYKVSFKFTPGKMQMAEVDLGKVSDSEVQATFSKTEPAITTAMRTDPAKGGTTGPVSILIEKSS